VLSLEEKKARQKIASRKYRVANRDKVRLQKAKWRKSNPDSVRATGAKIRLKNFNKRKVWSRNFQIRQYSVSPEQYKEMFDAQLGLCAICKRPDPDGRQLSIDHNHKCCPSQAKCCGKCVRGLLCGRCNRLLPLAEEFQVEIGVYLSSYGNL